jgi:hypothetical protein
MEKIGTDSIRSPSLDKQSQRRGFRAHAAGVSASTLAPDQKEPLLHHKHTLASAGDHSLLLARPESGTSRRKLVLATDWTTLVTGEKVWTRTQTPPHTAGWVDEVTPDGSIAWIVTSGAIRRMYHHSDGDELWTGQD